MCGSVVSCLNGVNSKNKNKNKKKNKKGVCVTTVPCNGQMAFNFVKGQMALLCIHGQTQKANGLI